MSRQIEQSGRQLNLTAMTTPIEQNGNGNGNGHKNNGHANGNESGSRATHGAKEIVKGESLNFDMLRAKTGGDYILGNQGDNGLVITNKMGEIVGAVRHPSWIPSSIIQKEGYLEVAFGGEQTGGHIEKSFLREFGTETSAEVGQILVDAAKQSVRLPLHASTRGSEVESFYVDKKTGDILQAPYEQQEELISGMTETALPPAETIEDGMLIRAHHTIRTQQRDVMLLNTSLPITGSIDNSGLDINNGKYKEYVAPVSTRLKPNMGRYDDYAGQVADHVAKMKGYRDLEEMVDAEPTMAYWYAAAGHHSVSLPHVEIGENQFIVPTEIAIAAADVAASDMAKITDLLMYSAPLLLGEAPVIQTPTGEKQPLDYRDVYRHLMKTTFPGDLILDPDTLRERLKTAILDGDTHTIDRAAFRKTFADGSSYPSYHGPVRLRVAVPENGAPIARVEYTGPGASFSLLDEAARDILEDVFNLAAFEAVANEKHPAEYWGKKYPSLATSANRMDIGRDYNFNGPSAAQAGNVIEQTIAFLGEMAEKYEPYRANIEFAQNRIANLRHEATAQNFEEYAQNPVGPVSQVMQNMYKAGYTPLDIAHAVTHYELQMAEALVQTNGDPKPLVNGIRVS